MTKCKLIINKMSGNSEKEHKNCDFEELLLQNYDVVDTIYIDNSNLLNLNMNNEIIDYDALAVCGGDGTLN